MFSHVDKGSIFSSEGYLSTSTLLFDSYPGHVHSHFEVLVWLFFIDSQAGKRAFIQESSNYTGEPPPIENMWHTKQENISTEVKPAHRNVE